MPPVDRLSDDCPVVYCADGHTIAFMAHFMAKAMMARHAPLVVLVGVHSQGDTRAEDYVLGVDPRRFAAHERFFTEEVPQLVREELGLVPSRSDCGVLGYSNGAALAIRLGLRHREKYSVAIAFSPAATPEKITSSEFQGEDVSRYYLAVGTRERLFKKNTRRIWKCLARHGIEHTYIEREAGHNLEFWKEELPIALSWAFGKTRDG